MRFAVTGLAGVAALALTALPVTQAAGAGSQVGLNLVLNTDITPAIVAELSGYGTVNEQYPDFDGLTMRVASSDISRISRLPYVESANKDVEVIGKPVQSSTFESTTTGLATWNTDQVDVYDVDGGAREVAETGAGVYVAVLDTGLHSSWPYYFGEERIAEEYGVAIGGGGGEKGSISHQPNKWSADQNGHGTHVTSTVIGYNLRGTAVAGVAPEATVIPVKVLNQNGSGWSSVVAAGIDYVTDLKTSGALGDSPVVINMSLGGPDWDALSQAAVTRALDAGVLIVAAAGNEGETGMGYPGAMPEVISVAAAGWTGEWMPAGDRPWWYGSDVADPTSAEDAYITDFSSRALAGQDLDVAAPGSWIVGPYQLNSQLSYYYLGGTSMASPHVAGAVALMAERNPGLEQADAEAILESTAIPLPGGSRQVLDPNVGSMATVTWGDDASGSGLMDVPAALDAAFATSDSLGAPTTTETKSKGRNR
ncbi:MAG TPA: S8 family serine peptidase [Nocardioidaceae bacterium]|nr:S8 family serine peptidase [Nocardioidaceae bacterium]